MRILYLTNGFPYPLTSGRLRQFHFIRELSQRHSVTLVSVVGESCSEGDVAAMEPWTERVVTVVSPAKDGDLREKTANRLSLLFTGSSPVLRVLHSRLKSLLREQQFDAVILSVATLPALEGLTLPPLIADVCDSATLHLRGRLRCTPLIRQPMLRLAIRMAQKFTTRVAQRADHLLFASRRDLEAAVGGSFKRADVVPNGVDLEYWNRTSGALGQNTIVFTGGMRYAPNTDAALQLIHHVLPRVRQSVPDARLLIVGHSPPPALVEAGASTPGVEVTGFVDDVRPYLEQSTVFAAPLRFGAGIQNKLLEAMAMEVPVITSQLAADGLLPDGEALPPVEVAESADEFAAAIVRRLAARAGDPAPDAAGRQFVEEHFHWEGSAQRLERVLNRVARVPVAARS